MKFSKKFVYHQNRSKMMSTILWSSWGLYTAHPASRLWLSPYRLPIFSREIQCRKNSGNENPLLCNGSHDRRRNEDKMLKFVGKTCCKWTILLLLPVEKLRSSFCGIFGQIHSPVQLQVTEMLTTFCAVYNHIVALKFLKRIELNAYR